MLGEDKGDFVALILNWRSIVGDFLASKTRVISVKDSVILIGVDNNVVMQELVLLKEELKRRINRVVPMEDKTLYFVTKDNAKRNKNRPFTSFS